MLTQEKLKSVLKYNPDTGHFTRLVWSPKEPLPGRPAGSLKKGYISIKIDYKDYKAHRLAWLYMTGTFPEAEIDHVDGDKANNRWENLRLSNPHHNQITRPLEPGITGTTRHGDKWRAHLTLLGRHISLGSFETRGEAYQAYLKGRKYYLGDTQN